MMICCGCGVVKLQMSATIQPMTDQPNKILTHHTVIELGCFLVVAIAPGIKYPKVKTAKIQAITVAIEISLHSENKIAILPPPLLKVCLK